MSVFSYKRIPDKHFDKYILKKYKKLSQKFVIPHYSCPYIDIRALVYSIMIYENFNRPLYLRMLEYLVFAIKKHILQLKCIMSLGIMQVQSDTIIGDAQSIKLAIIKILQQINLCIKNLQCDQLQIIKAVANDYNNSSLYYNEISRIYTCIAPEKNDEGSFWTKCYSDGDAASLNLDLGKTIFWVGAGVSKAAGLPLGAELTDFYLNMTLGENATDCLKKVWGKATRTINKITGINVPFIRLELIIDCIDKIDREFEASRFMIINC